jgi:ribosomal protein L11 methylase PrmA
MHATTLEHLKDHLLKAKSAIDIGTGSGYLAACFAEMMP